MMTNERAIELLHRISDSQFDGKYGDERREALEMAVRALEGDGDTISRKMAIEYLMTNMNWYNEDGYESDDDYKRECITDLINGVPSAQPERKKGKWLVDEDGNMECPFCGNTCGFGNYCNECGADLRGESNEFI